jgi:phage shock protein A
VKHEEQAEDLERQAENLEERGERVDRQIDETRSDWESKEQDSSVPGAQPESDEAAEEVDEEDDS